MGQQRGEETKWRTVELIQNDTIGDNKTDKAFGKLTEDTVQVNRKWAK